MPQPIRPKSNATPRDYAAATPAPGIAETNPRPALPHLMATPFAAVVSPPQRADEVGRLVGYRLLRMIGQGGMGCVFEAEDVALKRRVAVKVVRPEIAAASDTGSRFLREAQAAAALNNDHVVPIYQVGEENGVPFLVMPFLRGDSLEDRLERAPRLSLKDAVRYARQTAQGLAAAHAAGLIHRDIKPGNLWLEEPPADITGVVRRPRIRILDFGLARAESDEPITQTGLLMGTPEYMAPEQARGSPIDFRTDLFSLGGVLYELLTGNRPFRGKDTWSLLYSVVNDSPTPPCEVDARIPSDLSALAMKLLEKDPENRPQSTASVVANLGKIEKRIASRPRSDTEKSEQHPAHIDAYRWSDLQSVSKLPSAYRLKWSIAAASVVTAALIVTLGWIALRRADNNRVTPTDNTTISSTDSSSQQAAPPAGPKTSSAFNQIEQALTENPGHATTLKPIEQSLTVRPGHATVSVVSGKASVSGDGERRTLRLMPADVAQEISVQVEAKGYESIRRAIPSSAQPAPETTTFDLEPKKFWLRDFVLTGWKAEFDRQIVGSHSFSMHPPNRDGGYAVAVYEISGYRTFHAKAMMLGSAAADSASPMVFAVFGDKKLLWASRPVQKRDEADECVCDVTGVSRLELRVRCADGNGYAWGAWIDPFLTECDAYVDVARDARAKQPPIGAVEADSFWNPPSEWIKNVQKLEIYRLVHKDRDARNWRWLTGNDVEAKNLPKGGYWESQGPLGYTSGSQLPGTTALWRQHDGKSNQFSYYLSKGPPRSKQDGILGFVWTEERPGLMQVFVLQDTAKGMQMYPTRSTRDSLIRTQNYKEAFSFYLIPPGRK